MSDDPAFPAALRTLWNRPNMKAQIPLRENAVVSQQSLSAQVSEDSRLVLINLRENDQLYGVISGFPGGFTPNS
jgi:hypothetical protein